jgi:hypothetical protein
MQRIHRLECTCNLDHGRRILVTMELENLAVNKVLSNFRGRLTSNANKIETSVTVNNQISSNLRIHIFQISIVFKSICHLLY